MKKLLQLILLILLLPSLAFPATLIMGGNTNNSTPYSIVVTNAATAVSVPSATLNGTAYNYNSTGTSYFLYGTTSALGTFTSRIAFAGNTSTQAFSISVAVASATTYYFKACVTNAAGDSCGATLTFSTLGAGTFTRVGAFSGGTAGCNPKAHVIDTVNRVGYVTCDRDVVKYNLDTLAQVGSVTLVGGGWLGPLFDMALDQTRQLLYVALDSSSTTNATYAVVNANAAASAPTFNAYVLIDDGVHTRFFGSIVTLYDSVGDRLYVTPYTTGGDANGIAAVAGGGSGTVITAGGSPTPHFQSLILDQPNGWFYSGLPAAVLVAPPDNYVMARFDTNYVNTTSYNSGIDGAAEQFAIDRTGANLYFNIAGNVQKTPLTGIALTAFANPGAYSIDKVGADGAFGYVYFGVGSSPARIGSIRTSDFSQITTLVFNAGENDSNGNNAIFHSMQIDTTNHVLYYLLSGTGVVVVKIQLN